MFSVMLTWFWKTKIGILIAGFIAGILAVSFFYTVSYNNRIESQKEIIANLSSERDILSAEVRRSKEVFGKEDEQHISRIENVYKQRIDLLNERLSIIATERDSLKDQYGKLYQTYIEKLGKEDRQKERANEMETRRKQEQVLQLQINDINKEIKAAIDQIGKSQQSCSEYNEGKNLYFVSSSDCVEFNTAKYQLETLKQDLTFYKDQLRRLTINSEEY